MRRFMPKPNRHWSGISVAVYGTYDTNAGGVITTYTLDGDSEPVTTTEPVTAVYHALFYQSKPLVNGQQ